MDGLVTACRRTALSPAAEWAAECQSAPRRRLRGVASGRSGAKSHWALGQARWVPSDSSLLTPTGVPHGPDAAVRPAGRKRM
jgi:hypothetical protein